MESFDNRFTSQVDFKHIYMQFVKKEHLLVTNLPDRIQEIYYTQALIVILFTHACQNK
jgi:hypothetical protein